MSSALESERFADPEKIGGGGMGVVYRARDRTSGEMVALKVVLHADEASIARFERECLALARVSHPGVVRYVAHGRLTDGRPYLAMAWHEGFDLSRALRSARDQSAVTRSGGRHGDRRVGTLEVGEVLALGRRVAAGLGALHALGIVHRDVKPSNVFLPGGEVGRALVLDLGAARMGALAGDLTGTGVVIGTPWYMAPEQARSDREMSAAVDVFALGCVLTECLVGESPFRADHFAAALARILLDDPPPLRELRPDVPAALSDLVARMLSKDPQERPRDGMAVLAELDEIDALDVDSVPRAPLSSASPSASAPAFSGAERRVRTLLLARREGSFEEAITLPALEPATLERFRVSVVPIVGGLLVTSSAGRAPTDEAVQIARAALALRTTGVAIAVATGQAELGRGATGELSDRAAALLATADRGEIRVDPLTSALLENRFALLHEGGYVLLERERDVEAPRTLLGKPTRTFGRRRELALLAATYDECAEDGVARAVLLTAPAGMGKSRLRWETLAHVARHETPAAVILGQGDALTAGSPYSMLAPAIRRDTGVAAESSPTERFAAVVHHATATLAMTPRQARFLAELAGTPAPHDDEVMKAARADPTLLAEGVRDAFEAWLRALTRERPVVLVLDDLHWGDLPSTRLVDAALRSLGDRPLFVLALARPEVHEAFPSLFVDRPLTELRLDPLGAKAATELVREALGEGVGSSVVEAIVARADGNAFFLEELIRASSEAGLHGPETLPEGVLGMVQSRIDGLPSEARRVLRAASVFGEVFAEAAIEHLLAGSTHSFRVDEWLAELEKEEVLVPVREPRLSGQRDHRFRHALVRDAAYAMIPEADRASAHLAAAAWLEAAGERDPLVLARHARLGLDLASAGRWMLRAAEQALEASDLAAARARATDALSLTSDDGVRGAAARTAAVAAYWTSDYAASVAHGEEALARLPAGSEGWLVSAGTTLVSLSRLGETARFDALFAQTSTLDVDESARPEQVVVLARATFQLIFAGRFEAADRMLARVGDLAPDPAALPARCAAQVHHVRGLRAAMVGDVGTFLVHLERAVAAFERAGDEQNALLERTTIGWCWSEVGLPDRAEATVRENLARCMQARAQQAITYADVNLGHALSLQPARRDEARQVLKAAIAACAAVRNARLEGWASAHLAALSLDHDDALAAELEARTASERLAGSPGLRAWADALWARALVRLGRLDEALARATSAMATLDRLGGMLQGETVPPLALAEVLGARGDEASAGAWADAERRLLVRAARLPEPSWRTSFLARRDSRQTLAGAAAARER